MIQLVKGRVNMVITRHSLRYAYQSGDTLDSIEVYGERLLPPNTIVGGALKNRESFVRIVSDIVSEHGWKRKKLVFCLIDDAVYIRDFDIPGAVTDDEAKAYILTQTGAEFQMPYDAPSIHIEVLSTKDDTTNVRLFAYPSHKVDGFVQAFKDAGMKPKAADLTALSVFRYYDAVLKKRPKHVLLAHWNRDSMTMTAFNRGLPVFCRHIPLESPDKKSKSKKGVKGIVVDAGVETVLQAGVTDILRMLDFYKDSIHKGKHGVEQLVIAGDFPYIDAAKERLAAAVTIPVYDFIGVVDVSQADEVVGGAHGRSTRLLPFELQMLMEDGSDSHGQAVAKYVDLFGLCLKP